MLARRQCPQHFQERLTSATGRNRYGEPLFLIAWGQTHTFSAGGMWPNDKYIGYRSVMTATGSPNGKGKPCWMILEWNPPECSEAVWYYLNRDEATGLQTLGAYPSSGRYSVALKLETSELVNGKMVLDHYELDSRVLDYLIPIIVKAKAVSLEKRVMHAQAERAKLEEKMSREIDDAFRGAAPAFHGATISHANQRTRATSVSKKVEQIERQWTDFLKGRKNVARGFGQGKPF